MAHAPFLAHADEGRVDGAVAVGMVALHRFADDARALRGRRRRTKTEVVHGHEDAALRWFQTVAHVGQGPADDDAHGVAEVAILELIFDFQGLVLLAVAAGNRAGREWISGGR